MDEKMITGLVGMLLGGALSAIGYYFKRRREVTTKINESLFYLLEVWKFIVIVKVASSDRFYHILLNAIKIKLPNVKITDNDKELIRESMVEFVPMFTGANDKENFLYLDKYKSSVKELAKIFPHLAFNLNRNQMLIRFLGAIDKLFSKMTLTEIDKQLLTNIREFMLDESFVELESDLITLSSLTGIFSKVKTKKLIFRVRNRINEIPNDIFDDYIDKVIRPAVQAHYDRLGIENPNLPK